MTQPPLLAAMQGGESPASPFLRQPGNLFRCAIPLLAKEGWREAPGWSLTPKGFEMRFETWRVSDHPVSAASEASRHFLSGRATPPSQGGECAPLKALGAAPDRAISLWFLTSLEET